jgi:hypothetical protein
MAKPNALDALCEACPFPIRYATYSPGDGVTRYRFFETDQTPNYDQGNYIYTALGIKAADLWLCGVVYGSLHLRLLQERGQV